MKFKRVLSAFTSAVMILTPAVNAELYEDISNTRSALVEITAKIPNMLAIDAEVVSTGTCGASLTWTLYKGNILEISGAGDMDPSYTAAKNYPWHQKRDVIKQIIIGDEVTSIGDYAFNECIKVTSVKLGANVKKIGTAGFALCEKLESVTVNDKLVSMSGSAFDNCPMLKSFTFPDTLVNVDGPYFCGCMSLTSITVGENNPVYSSDENGILYNKDKTTLIRYPAKGQKTELVVPESVTAIERYAFWDSTTLASIDIHDGVKTIGEYAFSCCTALESVTLGDGIDALDQYVFYGCSSLTAVTIPKTVKSIGIHAFENCKSLLQIVIPDTVTKIDSWAFGNCTSLETAVIGGGITKIPLRAFADCKNLTSLTIGENVEIISDGAFEYCESLKTVTIPESVTTIGNEAFKYCTALESFVLPDSVTSVGEGIFYTCTSLETVTLGTGIETISYEMFYECSSLKNVIFGDNIKTIDVMAFAMCSGLESIYIPKGVEKINSYAFNNCTSLKEFNVSKDNKMFSSDDQGILFDKYKEYIILYPIGKTETAYTVPNSVYEIGADAFYGCETLKTLILGENVDIVGAWAFGYCTNLEAVQLNEWVYDIGAFAFYGCDSLKDVYFVASEDIWEEKDIKDGNEPLLNAVLHFESTMPEHVEIPTFPEFTEGSNYRLDEENLCVIVKPASKSGESLDAFMGNIATDSVYIQIVDESGAVKTENSKLVTGYKLRLLGLDGSVTKTYTIVMLGDIDRNGRYAFSDASSIEVMVSGSRPAKNTVEFIEADVDSNTRLSFQDASVLQLFIVNGMW